MVNQLFKSRRERQFYLGLNFEVRAYAAPIFHALRLLYSLKVEDLSDSISAIANNVSGQFEATAGNSGSEILVTSDR